jgi:primase-polymerase (primpol)-like protein
MKIPAEMRVAHRWVVWRYEQRDGRRTKVLYNPNTGRRASSTNPGTWATLDEALRALASGRYAGLGFVLGGGFAGVDLDKCRDAHTGEIAPWALAIINQLASYTEASPSGTGVHVLVLTDLSWQVPGRKITRPDGSAIEIYGAGRYFTFTGHALTDAPLTERTETLRALIGETFGPDTSTPATPPTWTAGLAGQGAEAITDADLPRSVAEISDEELLDRMFAAENGEQVRALFEGDTRGDHSVADLALCSHLAFWTQRDRERIDRLFRRSRLMRAKWNRADYRARTIERAINNAEIYEPPVQASDIDFEPHIPACDLADEDLSLDAADVESF